ncbi:MAG: DUF503 domain-containing protein [Acidobacteriota bacterium]
MVVGICTVALYLPCAESLKEKRKVLKSLKDRLRSRHNISLAEVDYQDLWQRSVLGIAAVADARRTLEGLFDRIRDEIENQIPGEIVGQEVHYV